MRNRTKIAIVAALALAAALSLAACAGGGGASTSSSPGKALGATWLQSRRFSAGADKQAVAQWLKEIGLA